MQKHIHEGHIATLHTERPQTLLENCHILRYKRTATHPDITFEGGEEVHEFLRGGSVFYPGTPTHLDGFLCDAMHLS